MNGSADFNGLASSTAAAPVPINHGRMPWFSAADVLRASGSLYQHVQQQQAARLDLFTSQLFGGMPHNPHAAAAVAQQIACLHAAAAAAATAQPGASATNALQQYGPNAVPTTVTPHSGGGCIGGGDVVPFCSNAPMTTAACGGDSGGLHHAPYGSVRGNVAAMSSRSPLQPALLSPFFYTAAAAAYAAAAGTKLTPPSAPQLHHPYGPIGESAFLQSNLRQSTYGFQRHLIADSMGSPMVSGEPTMMKVVGGQSHSGPSPRFFASSHRRNLDKRPPSPGGPRLDKWINGPAAGANNPTRFARPPRQTGPVILENSSQQNQQSHTAPKRAPLSSGNGRSCCLPVQPFLPSHFMRGTLIQLASGELKPVEELNSEDFINSADLTNDLKVDSSEVVAIDEKTSEIVTLSFAVGEQKSRVSVDTTQEHPFFVIGQGWSSYNPDRTHLLYGLCCEKLKSKDCCISLTPRDKPRTFLSSSNSSAASTNSRSTFKTPVTIINAPNPPSTIHRRIGALATPPTKTSTPPIDQSTPYKKRRSLECRAISPTVCEGAEDLTVEKVDRQPTGGQRGVAKLTPPTQKSVAWLNSRNHTTFPYSAPKPKNSIRLCGVVRLPYNSMHSDSPTTSEVVLNGQSKASAVERSKKLVRTLTPPTLQRKIHSKPRRRSFS